MSRKLMASALFGIGMLGVSALGQPPVEPNQATKKKANPVDALIAAALANDPDVRMAQAKLQLVDAELAKARQAVAVKVITLSGAIEEQKRTLSAAEDRVAWAARMVEKKLTSEMELLMERRKLESEKAKLAQLETELKLLVGGGPLGGAAGEDRAKLLNLWKGRTTPDAAAALTAQRYHDAVQGYYNAFGKAYAAIGPIADRLRAALDKPVKLGPKDTKVTFDQAMEIFKKEAGLDVPFRDASPNRALGRNIAVGSGGEELPVGAWFQLFQDFNGGAFYVRDYGLLYTTKESAPPDALTVTQFWKQKATK